MKPIFSFFLLLLLTCSTSVFSQRINDLTGINAHPADPLSMQKRFSWVRVWHDWSNDMAYAANCNATCPDVNTPSAWQFQWNPSLNNQTGPKLNYDTYYKSLSKRGIPVLKGIAPQLRGNTGYPVCYTTGQKPLEQKPICLTSTWCNPDPTACGLPDLSQLPTPSNQQLPATFKEHSLWVSLFAAKFGQSIHPLNYVQSYLSPTEAFIIGTNLIQYLENNNEPNKSWYEQVASDQDQIGNTKWYFAPLQFAAMLKADLDGNGSNLTANGKALGITNFSTGITPVMGGLSGLHGEYLNHMGGAPGWIPNFHHYSTDLSKAQNSQGAFDAGENAKYSTILINGNGGYGVSPELDSLGGKLQWLKAKIGGKNYWLSEFGYDSFGAGTSNNSGVEARPISGSDGTYDSQKVQAQWLTRGVLTAAYSKAVDKMMLYELTDHPTANNENYSFSGLATQGGKTKRAWYYIMTLKSILGEYSYNKAVKHVEGGFSVQTRPAGSSGAWTNANWDKIRVYEFRQGSEKIFAIWSPTEAAVAKFEVKIQFPDPQTFGLEYALNGSATLHEIKELSEKGRRWNWSSHVSGQTITINGNVLVSETPIFLHINKTYSSYPVPPGHATNLQCNPTACCGSVELSWTPPAGVFTSNTLVYYKEKTGATCPAFDEVSWTLFANNLGSSRKNVTITGLEQGKKYCFVVLPVAFLGGLPPDNFSLAQVLDCNTEVGSCSSCLINIAESEITIGANSDLTLAKVKSLLGIDGNSNVCTDINPSDCNASQPFQGWHEWKNPAVFPEANTFYINFTTPKLLKAIFAQDWTGNGDVLIQYEDCYCPNYWKTLTTLKMEGLGQCNGTQYFIKHVSTNVLVKKLRITKLHPEEVIRRLYFCGADNACPDNIIRQPGGLSDFSADEIRRNAVALRWTAAKYNTLDEQSDYIEKYQLNISQQLDGAGELVNPLIYGVEAEPYESEVMYRLDGLAPATTYYAEIRIPTNPCPPVPAPPSPGPDDTRRTSFTTESELDGRSSDVYKGFKTQTEEPYKVFLQPNPASNEVRVSITTGELETVFLMDMNGRIMKKFSASGNAMSLNLDDVQSGIYWIRTIRKDKTILTVLLVRQ